jgi:hypothetical protein
MLAGLRSWYPLLLVAFALSFSLPALTQVNGVPASVTSFGFGGHTTPPPGVRASVTSLGPNGYASEWPIFGGCCNNFLEPVQRESSRRNHRRNKERDQSVFPVGIVEPVYIPYGVPEANQDSDDVETDANGDPEDNYVLAPELRERLIAMRARKEEAEDIAEEQIVAQPSTVLVFKDGHKSDVLNYAIVGDTLFDFGDGLTRKIMLADLDLLATRKVNDDRGVDFQIPSAASQP